MHKTRGSPQENSCERSLYLQNICHRRRTQQSFSLLIGQFLPETPSLPPPQRLPLLSLSRLNSQAVPRGTRARTCTPTHSPIYSMHRTADYLPRPDQTRVGGRILPTRTPDIIAHWQVAPPARPPSRGLSHMILTEPCCCFPDIPNMEWHNKNIFWYNIYNTNIHI